MIVFMFSLSPPPPHHFTTSNGHIFSRYEAVLCISSPKAMRSELTEMLSRCVHWDNSARAYYCIDFFHEAGGDNVFFNVYLSEILIFAWTERV